MFSRRHLDDVFGHKNFEEVSSLDAQLSRVDRPNVVEHFNGPEDDVVVADGVSIVVDVDSTTYLLYSRYGVLSGEF